VDTDVIAAPPDGTARGVEVPKKLPGAVMPFDRHPT
jgi:hypothetical protein